jgi:hypothetical protein
MELKLNLPNLRFAFILIVTLLSIRLWSFHGIPDSIYDGLEFLVLVCVLFTFLTNFRKLEYRNIQFKTNVYLLILLPLLSAFGALIFHDQGLHHSLLILRTNFFWLLYFVLHIFNIPVKDIIKMMLIVGFIWVVLTIVQQFTYPLYLFFTRSEEEGKSILRAGVYRFMLYRHHYGLFLVLFFYSRYLKTKAAKHLVLVLVGLIGFYYFGTRQFAVAAIACLVIASVMQRGSAKFYSILLVTVLLGALYYFQDILFSGYIEMTSSQLESEDEIRMLAASFYLFEYWPHWFATIIGNGMNHSFSTYGMEISKIEESMRFFRSDIGLIGAFSKFGILYVINLLWINFKGLKGKYYTAETGYLRLFFLNTIMLLFISEYFSHPSAIPFFCFILYLVDKSYQSKKFIALLYARIMGNDLGVDEQDALNKNTKNTTLPAKVLVTEN